MPRLKRKSLKHRTTPLTRNLAMKEFLRTGMYISTFDPDAPPGTPGPLEAVTPAPWTEAELRGAWQTLRDEIIEKQKRRGGMPDAWWWFDSPEPRNESISEREQLEGMAERGLI
jgi:hypothetical protein